jgi:hypothetical protein
MLNKVLSNITIVNSKSGEGKQVKIKVISGIDSFVGKDFLAQKIIKNEIASYHVVDNNIKTYFLEKDVVEI